MGFALFILLNALLFLRPAELVPELEELPFYLLAILACAVVSYPEIGCQLTAGSLATQPITGCVLGMGMAVVLSQMANGLLWDARVSGFMFAKLALYYLLLVGQVHSAARLRRFLLWLVGFVVILTVLAVLQYRGRIELPGLAPVRESGIDKETGEVVIYIRLCSTGIFNDPNDLSLILVFAILAGLYFLDQSGRSLMALPWAVVVGLFCYALVLTQSRGGLLALLVGVLVLFRERFGVRKALMLAVVAVPPLFVLAGGRQTSLTASEGTGQDRIQLWSEGLAAFRQAPLFGIGQGRYEEEFGLVAHNSFVHCYTELGILGGTFFLGAFYLAYWLLHRAGQPGTPLLTPELEHLRCLLTAVVAGYAVGMLTLTRAYIVPTFLILGLATAFLNLIAARAPALGIRWDGRLVRRLAVAAAVFLLGTYTLVRLLARWG
jgi:O-antigen ligase